ncbi:RNA-directed DNA polymerase, eukaryota, reverse transcriptase zinc-binding domain protein [Tanacetum coccineum]
MDSMTSYVCKNGLGRTEFARVLVEIEAIKGFKNEVEIQYRDKDQGIKGTKKVKVEYDWKAPLCSHCKVFGHNFDQCTKRVKTTEELAQKEAEEKKKREELEFQAVQNRNKRNVRNAEVSKQGKGHNQSNKERSFDEEFPRLTKQNNHNSKNKEVRESSNKFSVLNGINGDDIQDLNMLKDKMLVDKYLNIKIHPSTEEMKNWSKEMREYFKRSRDRNDIVTEFVKHFEKFLGQSQHVEPLGELEGIFTNTLSHDEALEMVKDVTDKEIKNAMFDISDCKASGPDGYSACLFKKDWAVVDKDVCQAIKDFFENGKLLKEINSTLIALIPKVAQPNNVTEFRPIACCNGRSIQDNILLTQELLKGYNKKGGLKRCSLKIDIAKAYDTVSWEFLRNILRMFGFHDRMIEWICTCITSTSLSISINGESHGNFKKGRGLRQGDPISSYLFTLMEVFTLIMNSKIQQAKNFKYHVGCKEMKLTHLCFADDLLVLCHGNEESVIVIKEALDLFSKVSCLKPNINKSTIYFSNVDIGEKCRILNIMPLQVGSFPTRYLGVPLISKRLGKTKCKQLVDKVKSKVEDWKNKFLSYAGRVQLIASVLSSMHIYWASVFLLPKSTVKDIERVFKGFLWNQGDVVRGKAKIAWKTIFKLKGRGVWEIDVEANDSWIWKNLLNLRSKARRHIEYKIRNGENTLIWFVKWCESGPLCQIITNIDIYDARFNLKASVADMITNGEWIWND